VYQQGHVTTHLTGRFGTGIPGRTRNTVETGTVLHGFSKLKPVPVPMHTRDTLSRVYPYPCHALTKDETFDAYVTYEALMKTQYNVQIKKLHTDRGGEYLSNEFSDHLAKAGTVRQLTVHDTPEYNGVAERLNHTLLVKIQAML